MFSKKVTCAVIVLNELHSSSENLSGGKQIKISQLNSVCGGMTAHEITTILRELYQYNNIDRMDQGVILTCNPSEVTLYQLITSLHGDILIREGSEQDYHRFAIKTNLLQGVVTPLVHFFKRTLEQRQWLTCA